MASSSSIVRSTRNGHFSRGLWRVSTRYEQQCRSERPLDANPHSRVAKLRIEAATNQGHCCHLPRWIVGRVSMERDSMSA